MAIKSSVYICDKCKSENLYLSSVFVNGNFDDRLCDNCLLLFKEQYKLWCNDPVSIPFSLPVKYGPFRVKKPWWKG